MRVLSPFGPKIAVIKIPLNLVKKINDEVEKQISKEKPFMSFLMKFMNLPMNIYRFFKHNIMLFEFYMCAKEVEYLKIKLGLIKKRIEK